MNHQNKIYQAEKKKFNLTSPQHNSILYHLAYTKYKDFVAFNYLQRLVSISQEMTFMTSLLLFKKAPNCKSLIKLSVYLCAKLFSPKI